MPSWFKLTHHFTAVNLIAFALIAIAFTYFQERQSTFLQLVQQEEIQLTGKMQLDAMGDAAEIARQNLLGTQGERHADLARQFSNTFWKSDIAPLMEQVGTIDFDRCRAVGATLEGAGGQPSDDAQTCFAAQGRLIRALPRFAALDGRVRGALQGSSVVRFKIYDLRGVTVYSSEPAQVGEDGSARPGWLGATQDGKVVSELMFRDSFSTLQGVVQNRDLIASHVPVMAPGAGHIVGVFAVYTDATPFTRPIKASSLAWQQSSDDHRQRAARQAQDAQEQVDRGARTLLMVVAALLALLYLVLLPIVRRAQKQIDSLTQENDANRQRLAQTEKMTSLGHMVAGVAHQLNTPLTFSKSNVFMTIQSLDGMLPTIETSARMLEKEVAGDPDATQPHELGDRGFASTLGRIPDEMRTAQEMLGDVLMGMDQMNELVNNLRNFTRMDHARTSRVNLNSTLSSVVYVARSVISTKVRVVEAFEDLPQIACNVSQLSQAFLNLIVNAAQAIRGAGTVTVSTSTDWGRLCVSIVDTGEGIPDDVLPRIFEPYFTTKPAGEGTGLGLAIAKDIVVEHGGKIVVDTQVGVGSHFRVYLPLPARRAS